MKVSFDLPEDDWHGYGSESMWAEDLSGGRYRLRNIPFAVYGYSLDDVVRAEEADGRLVVTGPVFRSGRSTFRIFLEEGITVDNPLFKSTWEPLEAVGCTLESATSRLVAIDVPPEADLGQVNYLLELGKHSGVWDCEEGHRGQLLVRK